MSSAAQSPRQQPSVPDIPSNATVTAPTLTSHSAEPSSSSLSQIMPTSSDAESLKININNNNNNNNNPLTIPEILELVLQHVLLQFQTSIHAHHYPFASSSSSPATSASSSSSMTTTADIQQQILAQRPVSTRLAFLRVCQLWHQVGEPLLWRDVKWADYQAPRVHQGIWNHWGRVRHLLFEYGKRTTDTELPLAAATTTTAAAAAAASQSVVAAAGAGTTTNRPNGPRARMRIFLGSDTPAARRSTSLPVLGSTASATVNNQQLVTTAAEDGGAGSNSEDTSVTPSGRPRIALEKGLEDLAQAMSRPSKLPCYRPTPLPLTNVINQMCRGSATLSANPPLLLPVLHRSQLKSLTLAGLFRLETFLEAILPFVPELVYLDICLRCYEWRDEIRLDKVLTSCPKLQYLCVDRNMIGRVEFTDDLPPPDEDKDYDDGYEEGADDPNHTEDEIYAGNPWHLKFAKHESGTHGQLNRPPRRQRPRQRPLELRVLKLKKVRMLEQGFVRLIKRCPLLEEMDVFSTIYWGWSPKFLTTVAQSCPKIRHLHLTSNYNTEHLENNHGGAMQAGIVILHETPQELPPTSNIVNGNANNATSEPSTFTPSPSPPYDPVVELIKLFPSLLSYDARYVHFQDRALRTLQQTCSHLERLDLTSCREVSSKVVDNFLRHASTLKHFSARRTVLRIEDLIEATEEHDRIVSANASRVAKSNGMEDLDIVVPQPRWWACDELETFIIGVKNPVAPGKQQRNFDLQAERDDDLQFYYRDYQGGPSSSDGSGSGSAGFGSRGGSATAPLKRPYDHTQYCTFVLFQQLGRLRRLKQLELHGGRFDLGIGTNYHPQQPSDLRPIFSSSSRTRSADQLQTSSSSHQVRDQDGEKPKTGSKALRGLGRMKSLLSLGGGGKGKQKATDEDSFANGVMQDLKGKGKDKDRGRDKGKGKSADKLLGGHSSGGSEGSNLDDWVVTNSHYECHAWAVGDNDNLDKKIVPSDLMGLQPLADLRLLQSFSMTWSNFPMLREQEMAWICQHWTSLEWISLGLIRDCEWDQIRSWVRSRRSDIIVVFER
ncbi:hypothetical protein BGZ58_003310 [Dissophora ornata]|nr:hypothetical protein BGZ58_003310 [Dissophora ornata]